MKKIAFFVGNDLSSAILLPSVFRRMDLTDWKPHVFFVKDPVRKRCDGLEKYSLFERSLLPTIYKILDKYDIADNALAFSPQGLSSKFNVNVTQVEMH